MTQKEMISEDRFERFIRSFKQQHGSDCLPCELTSWNEQESHYASLRQQLLLKDQEIERLRKALEKISCPNRVLGFSVVLGDEEMFIQIAREALVFKK